ncbi:MAG: T9SS type A sorting domain-containing protein [Cyclobacteriaceae bacterium]
MNRNSLALIILSFALSIGSSQAQTYAPVYDPDLPLETATAEEIAGVQQVYDRLADDLLGTEPSSDLLSNDIPNALNKYNNLNIVVDGDNITGGDNLTVFKDPSNIIRQFARYLRFYPNGSQAEEIKEKASNVIWLISQRFIDNKIPKDGLGYDYDRFARSSVLHGYHLSDKVKNLFGYTLDVHTDKFKNLWPDPNTGADYYPGRDYSTDLIYTVSDAMLGFGLSLDSDDEKVRWMKGMKRYYERFFTFSQAFGGGIKPDGAGFHHWAGYSNYMYAYKTAVRGLYALGYETPFAVGEEYYKNFRDAMYYQMTIANDFMVYPIALCGRKPDNRDISSFDQTSIYQMAMLGGQILGLSTADPVFAGYYNRVWGNHPDFNYTSSSPWQEGYFQMNHNHMGIFRKDEWIAAARGLSNYTWGTETYKKANRFGRYQSYGGLEIIYNSSMKSGNGYDENTWNWNHFPGTTTILLPFDKLHAENERIDEHQKNSFAGAVAFKSKNSNVLNKTHGTLGLFGIDFQGLGDQGFGENYGPDTHDPNFKFKKSIFAFDDIIVALGSNISTFDATHPTITTLYQRLRNDKVVIYNGEPQDNSINKTFDQSGDYWVMSNAGTGFYVVNGGQLTIWGGKASTPNHDEIVRPGGTGWTSNFAENNTYGYISHGTAPTNRGFEYVTLPATSSEAMTSFASEMKSNKPYKVLQKDASAHMVQHLESGIIGSAFFSPITFINIPETEVKAVNKPCLVMHEMNGSEALLTLANPDLGLERRQEQGASVVTPIRLTLYGEWQLNQNNDQVTIISASPEETILEFRTVDGLPIEVSISRNGDAPERPKVLKTGKVNHWKIYPNPVHVGQDVVIALPTEAMNQLVNIKISNLSGQTVYQETASISESTFRLTTKLLTKGLYLISIKGEQIDFTERLILN